MARGASSSYSGTGRAPATACPLPAKSLASAPVRPKSTRASRVAVASDSTSLRFLPQLLDGSDQIGAVGLTELLEDPLGPSSPDLRAQGARKRLLVLFAA